MVLRFPFFVLVAPSKPCRGMSVVVAFALPMSKSWGPTLKVIPLLGGPHEHPGPLLEILGSPLESLVRSTISLSSLFGSLTCETRSIY
jgi:hypothetical protein